MWIGTKPPGRLLDVGCGDGLFLVRMRELGWEVQGIEPDRAAASVAQSVHGLPVLTSAIEEASLAESSFDVITLGHVIEHVYDPVAVLRRCGRLLKPGGTLVVVTPNARSLGARWYSSWWRGWEIPRHLYVFSPDTLQESAERSGLEIDGLRTTARSVFHMLPDIRLEASERATRVAPWNRLKAWLFWLVEHGALRFRPSWGEEIVMVVSRRD
jgi:SAM-dependent methyltransferase